MLICSNCSKENPDHYKFCLGCGQKLSRLPDASLRPDLATTDHRVEAKVDEVRNCPSCQAEMPPGFTFCGRCGTSLPASVPSPNLAPPTPDTAPAHPEHEVASAPTMYGTMDEAQTPSSAEPDPSLQGRLILLREDGSEGGALLIEGGPQNIGRSFGPPFDGDAYLESEHAALTITSSGIRIEDHGTLNGIFLKIHGTVELQDQDQFRVGQELLMYEDLPEAAPAPDGAEYMGSPNPGYWGRLRTLVTPEIANSALPIASDGITIGREQGDITFPHDGYVSGQHCRIIGDDRGVFLEDLNSSNGTYMRIRQGQIIPHDSLLLIGQQLFRVDMP